MKTIKTIIIIAGLTAAASLAAAAQDVCSKPGGEQMNIYVRNATDKTITVNPVDENCKEAASDRKIEPGRMFSGEVTGGEAFRVRETGTNELLQTVIADPANETTTIGVIKNSDPRQSFIQTLNQIRRGRRLAPMELSEQLNNSCQWFADLMAKFDKGGHDAVLVGGSSYTEMQHPWLRSQKMGYKGDGGTEATGEGDVADLTMLGGDAMLGWSSSDTHYRPFLSQDNQIFKQVGFGYAKSAKKPNYYYTCAVFGNPDEAKTGGGAGNPDAPANGKAPIKTNVPDNLKFTEARFFQTVDGAEKYGASFSQSTLDELNAEYSFTNPSSQSFSVEVRSYLNGNLFQSESMKDLKGSGAMSVTVAGESGQTGKVAAGKYRFEVLLNGEVVLSAEAMVK